ncbi:hypothetical protein G9A89_004472 [Geosiphon pyriformis]|nr:hypothetical protein G9A89_004472 [Geosiphon pyriformis]
MTTNRAKSKKVANITFLIVTNKVSIREGLSVIEAARQNVLTTFLLKNNSNKLPLVAFGSFSSPLAGSSSPVKVPSKRHTRVSSSVVSTTSKSPKIFNNRPVNKLVFPALTTPTITSTTTASQMAMKAKNSKKQQQAVTTTMVTPNFFVVPDEIFSKISTAAASLISDIDGNSSGKSPKMGQDQPLAGLPDVVLSSRSSLIPMISKIGLIKWKWNQLSPPVSGASDAGAWVNVNGCQRFSSWVVSNLVPGTMFKIKMALLNAVKLFCATKVAIGDEVFLTTLKIARSSEVTSVSSPSLSVVLCDVLLGTSSNDIKSALGIFGVVTSVKLKPAGLWQYAVVNFKDISSAAAALSNWSVLVRKDSVRILPIANQKEVISSRDAFKAKLVNLPFGCTAFEINDLSSLIGAKSYAKAATSVVPPVAAVAAVAETGLAFSTSPKVVGPLLLVAFSGSDVAVNARLASLKTQLSELSLLIKSIVEPVGSLVALESVIELGNQIKGVCAVASVLQKEVGTLKLRSGKVQYNISDDENMDDDDDDNNDGDAKDFSVYDNTFDVMIEL